MAEHTQSLPPAGTARGVGCTRRPSRVPSKTRPPFLLFSRRRVEGHYAKPPMGFLRDHNDTRAKRRPTNPKRHGRATLSKGDKLGAKRQIGTLKSPQVESWLGPRTGHPNAALAQEYGLTYAGSSCRRLRCFKRSLPQAVVCTQRRIGEGERSVLHKAAHTGASYWPDVYFTI